MESYSNELNSHAWKLSTRVRVKIPNPFRLATWAIIQRFSEQTKKTTSHENIIQNTVSLNVSNVAVM